MFIIISLNKTYSTFYSFNSNSSQKMGHIVVVLSLLSQKFLLLFRNVEIIHLRCVVTVFFFVLKCFDRVFSLSVSQLFLDICYSKIHLAGTKASAATMWSQ